MTGPVDIRRAHAGDLSALIDLEARIAQADGAPASLPQWRAAGWRTGLASAHTAVEAAVKPASGDLLGYAAWRAAGGEAELLLIGVCPAERGRGVASRLLGVVMNAATAEGADTMFLDVGADNLAARAFYEKMGFHQVGIRARYYANGADALAMARTLAF